MYIPPSQYQIGFYSNGEYSFLTGEQYTGPYFKLLNGTTFSGKTPSIFSKKIIQFIDSTLESSPSLNNPNIILSSSQIITPVVSNSFPRIVPLKYSPVNPPKNSSNSLIPRYFVKKANEFIYYETDDISYNGITSRKNEYAWDLYSAAKIFWKIKGDMNEVYNHNQTQIFNIESPLSGKNPFGKNWLGFSQYFQDKFLKYYQSLTINDLYTSGGEFTTQNGQNYIGYYHIYNGRIPMVGKTHTKTSHEVLIPVINPSNLYPNPIKEHPLQLPEHLQHMEVILVILEVVEVTNFYLDF
jgi:hypothetical protein